MLSQLPITSTPSDPPAPLETIHVPKTLDSSSVISSHIQQRTVKDPTLAKVRDFITASQRPHDNIAKPYHKCWEELSVEQGCLLRGNRVVVRPKGRKAVIEVLHKGHQEGTRMKALARSFVWWPGIDADLENTISSCDSCQRTRHSPPQAPLHPWEFPSAP